MKEGSPDWNPWGLSIRRVLDMGQEKTSKLALTHDTLTKHGILRQDSFNIVAADGAEFVPIYEGKMFQSFNHRRRSLPKKGQGVLLERVNNCVRMPCRAF